MAYKARFAVRRRWTSVVEGDQVLSSKLGRYVTVEWVRGGRVKFEGFALPIPLPAGEVAVRRGATGLAVEELGKALGGGTIIESGPL